MIDYQKSRKILAIASVVYIVVSLFLFIDHNDYTQYILQWEMYLAGTLDPTYPPVFSMLFAPLYAVWYRLPKLVFVCAFLVTMWQMHEHLFKHPDFAHISEQKKAWFILLFFVISPNCWWHVWTGLFDGLLGLFVFNMYLVLKNRTMRWVVKDAVLLVLIALTMLIKFVGIFLLVPFLFFNLVQPKTGESEQDFACRRKKTFRIRLLVYVCGGASIGIAAIVLVDVSTILAPFVLQASRSYESLYEFALYPNSPFFLKFFVDLYSRTGFYIFLIAMILVYVYCIKAKVSNEAWLLLPMLTFMTFFQVVHAQFLLWILPLLGVYYAKHDGRTGRSHIRRHLFWIELIDGSVFFFLPFAQFMYTWVIAEVIKRETSEKVAVPGVALSPA